MSYYLSGAVNLSHNESDAQIAWCQFVGVFGCWRGHWRLLPRPAWPHALKEAVCRIHPPPAATHRGRKRRQTVQHAPSILQGNFRNLELQNTLHRFSNKIYT